MNCCSRVGICTLPKFREFWVLLLLDFRCVSFIWSNNLSSETKILRQRWQILTWWDWVCLHRSGLLEKTSPQVVQVNLWTSLTWFSQSVCFTKCFSHCGHLTLLCLLFTCMLHLAAFWKSLSQCTSPGDPGNQLPVLLDPWLPDPESQLARVRPWGVRGPCGPEASPHLPGTADTPCTCYVVNLNAYQSPKGKWIVSYTLS